MHLASVKSVPQYKWAITCNFTKLVSHSHQANLTLPQVLVLLYSFHVNKGFHNKILFEGKGQFYVGRIKFPLNMSCVVFTQLLSPKTTVWLGKAISKLF